MKIRIELNATTAELEPSISATGATILEQNDRYAILHASQTQLIELARIEGIAWIEQFSIYEKHNEYGAGARIHSNSWGSRYSLAGPMADDPTVGNKEQMAGWSSRGPTDDGRIKSR